MYRRLRILSTLSFIAIIAYPIIGISDEDVWAKLKQGGYVVLMRHAKAEKIGDPLTLKINDCSVQRNLSAQGQKEVALIGRVFHGRSVSVSEVLSSRYCRTQETAELAFGRVTTWQPLDLLYALPEQDRDARTEIVAKRISTYTGEANLVMITHLPNIDALTLELVEPGGFLVLEPDHKGSFDIVGYFAPDDIKVE
jgi:phosphohistidine phosphatase SixA